MNTQENPPTTEPPTDESDATSAKTIDSETARDISDADDSPA